MKIAFLNILLLLTLSLAQQFPERKYAIIQVKFTEEYDVIKIKVPNWLKTSEVMEQIRSVIIWPGEPLPHKITYIYVFKETDSLGSSSETGGVYFPGVGFKWDLLHWEPDSLEVVVPTDEAIEIYNTYMDSMLVKGLSFSNNKFRKKIARHFNLTTHQLDSLCVQVKYWWEKEPKPVTHVKK